MSQKSIKYDMIMNFDEMLLELGELGRFQLTTYFLICLPVMFSGANSLTYVFTAGVPNYRCYVPTCENRTNFAYETDWLPIAIPSVHDDPRNYKAAQCSRYVYTGPVNSTDACTKDDFSTQQERCTQWIFDDERTIVNDWNITCLENHIKLSFIGNAHFVGILLGSIMFGILSDRYGRKTMFIISIMLMSLAGVVHIISTSYEMFLALTLVHAIGTAGVYPLGFILGVEMVGPKKREFTAIVLNFFYAVGEAMLGVIAWLYHDWTVQMLLAAGPCIIFCVYFCFLPESVRWLLAKHKHKEAKEVVLQAAKINKKTLSAGLLETFKDEDQEESSLAETGPIVRRILKSRLLMIRYSIMCFVWLTCAFIYYGLSLNSTSLGGNKYLNFILACLIEIPGYILSWVAIVKIGRKYTLIGTMFVCSINCAGSVFVDQEMKWLILVLFLIGKLTITAAFGSIYVYTAELYPTIIRSGGVATTSTCARIGAFLAPFVPLLGIYFHYMPMLLFAIVAFIAGSLAFKLPETVNKKLPETIEEALNL